MGLAATWHFSLAICIKLNISELLAIINVFFRTSVKLNEMQMLACSAPVGMHREGGGREIMLSVV